MSGPEVTGLVVAVALLGFVAYGALAYLGRWPRLRAQMLADPEGYRHAASLPLGLLLVPAVVMTAVPPAPDGGLAWPHLVALVVAGALLVWAGALTVGGGGGVRALTRALAPRWWLRARELDRAGVRDSYPQAADRLTDGRPER